MPDYRKVVEGWMGRRMEKGSTLEESYRFVVGDIKGFYSAAVEIGREKGIAVSPVLLPKDFEEEFMEYLKEFGFQYKGTWYFKVTHLDAAWRKTFVDMGAIERVGTSSDLKRIGVRLQEDEGSSAVYYRANWIN